MSMKRRLVPVYVTEPDQNSKAIADRLHLAIIRGKTSLVSKILDCGVSVELTNRSGQTPLFCASYYGHLDITKLLLKLGADPNRRCSIQCCTPVHAACWSGNTALITLLLIAGGDLRLHDQQNRSPRDWAVMQPHHEARMATLALIESFRQMAMKSNDLNSTFITDSGSLDVNGPVGGGGFQLRSHQHATIKLPAKLRNTLAAMGLVCSDNCEYVGPYGNVQGTGFGKTFFGRGESAAALWPVPLVPESEIIDPDDEGCGVEADLNGLLPRGVNYRTGPTTEIVGRRWHQTPVSIRRMRENHPPDLLLEELHNISRLRHPGLMLLMGVSATQHWESVQLMYEPIYHGSLHHRLHIMGSSIPLIKRLRILAQICEALVFLHSKQLLHCSVSSHAVHMISSSRAKLGSLETLTEVDPENPSSRRVYRKVPSSHWDWLMPWLSPECARGEPLTTQSDVYSFCCLVWETCTEKVPRSSMDSKQIEKMWHKQPLLEKPSATMLLPLDPPAIPLHIGSFLKLGLQPEPSERLDMDLQEIYLMLRLQAAALSHSKQKEHKEEQQIQRQLQQHQKLKHQWKKNELNASSNDLPPTVPAHPQAPISSSSPSPSIQKNPHSWDAVKEQMKTQNKRTMQTAASTSMNLPPRPPPPPPPPLPASVQQPYLDSNQQNNTTIVLDSTIQHPLDERIDEEDETDEGVETTQLVPNENTPPEGEQQEEDCEQDENREVVNVSNRRIHFESEPAASLSDTRDVYATPTYNGDFSNNRPSLVPMMPGKGTCTQYCSEFAIKPASHTTERHSSNCLLMAHQQAGPSPVLSYHTPLVQQNDGNDSSPNFNDEMRGTKSVRQIADLLTWNSKSEEVGHAHMEDSSGDYEEEPPGHPSSTSTPRHLLQPGQELQPPHQQGMHSASFLACSSALMEAQEDPSQEVCDSEQLLGTKPKPKRVLPFGKTVTSPSSRTPSFLPCKPSTDLVASLKSYFQDPAGHRRSFNKNKKKRPLIDNRESPNIGDTFAESNEFVSRGVQCD